ncbi:MAG: signal peptidase I [Planctomycetota bacterium]|nr:signal peptidase I [Planctomycetota bacterium]
MLREELFRVLKFLGVLVAIIVVEQFAKRMTRVEIAGDNESMAPAFPPGKYRIVRDIRSADDLKPGDVVAYFPPARPSEAIVARVVAKAGQEVESDGKELRVDGREFSHPGAKINVAKRKISPTRVPGGCVFLLTDNPSGAVEMECQGVVPLRHIWGRLKG